MPPVVSSALLTLEKNPRELYLEVTEVLLRLANNVIKNPSDPKYRSIRLANPTVAKKLLPALGARNCLLEMGFKETGDCLVLPENTSLENLKAMHDQILARRSSFATQTATSVNSSQSKRIAPTASTSQVVGGPTTSQSSSNPAQSVSKVSSGSSPSVPGHNVAASSAVTSDRASASSGRGHSSKELVRASSKQGFIANIVSASECIAQYHTKEGLYLAKTYIPLVDLEIAALEQMRSIQRSLKRERVENGKSVLVEPSMQELLLVQLLSWFKEKFFSWVNYPPCNVCSGKTKFRRTETRSELRVEVYECALCLQETEFPRHIDPLKLLETRRGRCGEWGRCFTFLCLALEWDARLVIDETDHVWTEVYLVSQSKWVHCDPCENAFDTPLMYEHGWKKKLSYILAYAPDDVQDVTWRYSSNHREVMNRRKYCTEAQLLETIMAQRKLRQQNLSNARKAYLLKRTLLEIVELWKEPIKEDDTYQGRQSGSLAWRLARGEASALAVAEPYVWKPTQSEVEKKEIRIQYYPGLDKYQRGSNYSDSDILGWQNGVSEYSNVFRKEEKDWNMIYLARKEGCEVGHVTWTIDLTESGMVADNINLVLCSKVFGSGQVTATVCAADSCVKLPTEQPEASISTRALSGGSLIKLHVNFTGGNGNVAWQHSQLFRSELGSKRVGLDMIISLKSA